MVKFCCKYTPLLFYLQQCCKYILPTAPLYEWKTTALSYFERASPFEPATRCLLLWTWHENKKGLQDNLETLVGTAGLLREGCAVRTSDPPDLRSGCSEPTGLSAVCLTIAFYQFFDFNSTFPLFNLSLPLIGFCFCTEMFLMHYDPITFTTCKAIVI